jgi:hypothetical protein
MQETRRRIPESRPSSEKIRGIMRVMRVSQYEPLKRSSYPGNIGPSRYVPESQPIWDDPWFAIMILGLILGLAHILS